MTSANFSNSGPDNALMSLGTHLNPGFLYLITPVFGKLRAEYILFWQDFIRNLLCKSAISCTDFNQFAVGSKIPSYCVVSYLKFPLPLWITGTDIGKTVKSFISCNVRIAEAKPALGALHDFARTSSPKLFYMQY